MDIQLPLGLRDGELIHVSELSEGERGLKCNCICPHCHGPLIARLGEKKVHHFAHQNVECQYALESALHLFAKDVLERQKKIKLPKVVVSYGSQEEELYSDMYVSFDRVLLEYRIDNIIPDVILMKGNNELFVEIKVTHKVDEDKLALIKDLGISVLEIDLWHLWTSEVTDKNFDRDKVSKIIIDELEYKEWLFNSKAEERKLQMIKEEEERRKRVEEQRKIRALEEKRKREKKTRKVESLMNKDYQEKCRTEWDKEILDNDIWRNVSNYLRISSSIVPAYLNKEIEGDFVFNCDRRIWQARIFSTFIYRRLSRSKSTFISVKMIVEWLKKKPYPLPLNWELIYLKDVPGYSTNPDLAKVVCDFLLNLSNYGFVEVSELTRMNGGHYYYWWFNRLEEHLKFLPKKFQVDCFIEQEDKLVNLDTGEVVGLLSNLYIAEYPHVG